MRIVSSRLEDEDEEDGVDAYAPWRGVVGGTRVTACAPSSSGGTGGGILPGLLIVQVSLRPPLATGQVVANAVGGALDTIVTVGPFLRFLGCVRTDSCGCGGGGVGLTSGAGDGAGVGGALLGDGLCGQNLFTSSSYETSPSPSVSIPSRNLAMLYLISESVMSGTSIRIM